MNNPTVDEIRNLGFEWPKNILIEQYCVMDDGPGVDLFRTIGKLMKARQKSMTFWNNLKGKVIGNKNVKYTVKPRSMTK